MALPVAVDLRNYLRLSTTAEDTLLGVLVTRAREIVEGLTGLPIEAEARAWDLLPLDSPKYGTGALLLCPAYPLDADSVAVEELDGDAVAGANLVVDGRTGRIRAAEGFAFSARCYHVEADVGWDTLPDYATRIEPLLSAAILDVAADLAQNRNPRATQDATGGGIAVSTDASAECLARVKGTLRRLTPPRVW